MAACYLLGAAAALRRGLRGHLGWLVPPLFRAGEYGTALLLTAVVAPGALPAAFALVGAAAYHLYDTMYRLRGHNELPSRQSVWMLGGHDGRVLILILFAAAGPVVFSACVVILAAVLGVLVGIGSARFWMPGLRTPVRSSAPAETVT